MNFGFTFARVQRLAARGLLASWTAGVVLILSLSAGHADAKEVRQSHPAAPSSATDTKLPASMLGAMASAVRSKVRAVATGMASFYGSGFHGRRTASGEIFNKNAMVAAHPRYPMGTRIRVTNLRNGHVVVVRVVDRGPTMQHQRNGVIIDVSEGAASKLGMIRQGRAKVALEVLESGQKVKT